MIQLILQKLVWAAKQIFALVYPKINQSQGSVKVWARNQLGGGDILFNQIKEYHATRPGHKFDPRFSLTLLQDYSNPNTFNDWLLLQRGSVFRKIRVTGEGGKWKPVVKCVRVAIVLE